VDFYRRRCAESLRDALNERASNSIN